MTIPTQPSRAGAAVVVPPANSAEAAARLDAWFAACPGAAVAFSGGVDSALVAFWARRVLGRERATAYIGNTPSLMRSDLELARRVCATHDIPLREISTQELQDPAYASNGLDRCYHCKRTLYTDIAAALGGLREGTWICSGANRDDLGDYRPGLKAASEAGIRHPLQECGIGKTLVRTLAREAGLEVWDKPATPCLSSRVPYGQAVTLEKLSRIEQAELWLRERGFDVCRVRHVGMRAVVEVPTARVEQARALLPEFAAVCAGLGFEGAEVDAEGFVSGKLNRVAGVVTPAKEQAK